MLRVKRRLRQLSSFFEIQRVRPLGPVSDLLGSDGRSSAEMLLYATPLLRLRVQFCSCAIHLRCPCALVSGRLVWGHTVVECSELEVPSPPSSSSRA